MAVIEKKDSDSNKTGWRFIMPDRRPAPALWRRPVRQLESIDPIKDFVATAGSGGQR